MASERAYCESCLHVVFVGQPHSCYDAKAVYREQGAAAERARVREIVKGRIAEIKSEVTQYREQGLTGLALQAVHEDGALRDLLAQLDKEGA